MKTKQKTEQMPEELQRFMKDETARRFPEFHATVIARCVARMWPGGDTTEVPYFPQVKATNVLCRAASRAALTAVEGVGMTAKVDTGQRTRTKGRVLEVGTVLQMELTLWRRTAVRHRLRMVRPDGRTVERFVRIMRVHRADERRAG